VEVTDKERAKGRERRNMGGGNGLLDDVSDRADRGRGATQSGKMELNQDTGSANFKEKKTLKMH